jgi:hypothetical protein
MPKSAVIAAGVIGAIVVIGGAVAFINMNNKPAKNNDPISTSQNQSQPTVNDPNGDYKLFSDPSITKHPDDGVKFGNGQTLSFEYDGSKTNNDPSATLSYQLYYVAENGSVQPMGGGNMEGEGGKGIFKTAEGDKVFNSLAKDRPGFFELQGTYGTSLSETEGIKGTNVKLGMYAIKFDIGE